MCNVRCHHPYTVACSCSRCERLLDHCISLPGHLYRNLPGGFAKRQGFAERVSGAGLDDRIPKLRRRRDILAPDLYGPSSRVLASLSIAVGALTISPITLAILEMQATPGPRSFDIRKFLKCILLSFKRPVVWAPLVALLLLAVHVSLPPFALSSLGVLGNASTGTALLLTGLILSEQKLQVNFGVIASSLAKVVVQPLIVLGICLLLRVEISTLRQVTMICATPAGFFGLVFGKRFQAAPAVAAGSALILTYVLSIATLPLWAVIVTYIH